MQSKNTSYNCPSHSLIAYKQCWNNSPNTSARKIFCQVFQILIVPRCSTQFTALVKFSEIPIETSVAPPRWWSYWCQKRVSDLRRLERMEPFEMYTCLGPGAYLLFRHEWMKLNTLLSLQFVGEGSASLFVMGFFRFRLWVGLYVEVFPISTLTGTLAIPLEK